MCAKVMQSMYACAKVPHMLSAKLLHSSDIEVLAGRFEKLCSPSLNNVAWILRKCSK